MNFLRDITIEELIKIKGIGKVKAIQIKATCELASRMNSIDNYKNITINKPGNTKPIPRKSTDANKSPNKPPIKVLTTQKV